MMSETVSAPLVVHRNSRQIDAVVRRLRRAHAHACEEFREQPLSRRKRVAERRKELREPLHVPVYLHPCRLAGGQVILCETRVMGLTRDVSDRGVGLSFDVKIETPHVLAEFDVFGRGQVTMLVELRWVARRAAHAYVGGGLWVGIVKGIIE